ncbi:MAG: single-stranded DNA-binding protein, partial [Lewinella sp.]
NRQTKTEWHRVKAYGKLAEIFDQYLQRGTQVSIIGSMKYRQWTDKFEQTRTAAEVIAEEFSFLGGGKRRNEDAMAPAMVAEPEPSRSTKKTASRRAKKSTAQTVEN